MSLPPLSPAQRAAVEAAFDDALVTAGAGSGKTRVLAERFVHLVEQGHVDLRRLAALTFTEKAAAQMRERIADLFRRRAEASDGETAARYAQWRDGVEFAPISTIHSFCATLLREHAIEARLDPSFQMLDALEADLLEQQAADEAEAELAREHPDRVAVLTTLANEARPEVLSILRRLRGAGRDVRELTWHAAPIDLDDAIATVIEAIDAYDEGDVRDCLSEAKQEEYLDTLRQLREELVPHARERSQDAPFLATQCATRVRGLGGPRKKVYTSVHKPLREALDVLAGALLDRWGSRVLLEPLKQVLATYAEHYERLKRERGVLDFTDLELRTRDLLDAIHASGGELDLSPRALLVDEYQDTNPLQAHILDELRPMHDGAPQFSVGDAKQSIYRFRRADVQVILDEATRVGSNAVFPMHASYRSCEPLVRSVNAVNELLFDGGAAGVTYEPLVAAGDFLAPAGPVLDLAIIDGGKGAKLDDVRAIEAAWIAEQIDRLVRDEVQRLKPVRADDGTPTDESVGPIRYGDVAILFRAGGSIPIYEDALEARGIPFLTQKSKGFFQTQEVSDLVHVLRAIHNPHDTFALACLATGPAMGARDDEILRWFRVDKSSDDVRTPWRRMQDEAAAGGRHADALAILERLRVEAAGGALATTVERVLVDLGLYETVLMRPGGDRAAANLRKAVQVARQLDESGRHDLEDLLHHLETMRERETSEADAPIGGEADDVVRLTTVHGAKGLEYPVVFVADIGRRTPADKSGIMYDGEHGIAVRVADPLEGGSCVPAGHAAIRETEAARSDEESLRVLYVAMTRAEERLYLTAAATGVTGGGTPSYVGGWGRSLWDAMGLSWEHGVDERRVGKDDAVVRVSIVDGATVEIPERRAVVSETPEVTPAARAEAQNLLARADVPVAPLGDTRFVVSVSELLTFADSPQRYYRERLIQAGARAALSSVWDASPHEVESASAGDRDGQRAEAAVAWDEPREHVAGLDRAAVGRAVHAVLEHVRAGDETTPLTWLERAVEAEGGDDAFAEAVEVMVDRFLASPMGDSLRTALAEGRDVRREVALHARIRFPGGEPVAGFDSLLVKGSIDLWLPTDDGVLVVDHKTNRKGGAFDTPAALAEHYAWQLRLYALATERALGADVAGTSLMLLDPSWGGEALEVPVDVSGDALEETRRLCRAFAIAELEGRYPTDWRALVS